MSHRTWEDNAVEFGALSKQGVDVRLAVLVATSVEKDKHGGDKQKASDERRLRGKTSSVEFAGKAETTDRRVLRHLDAWVKCAAEGWCEVPSGLKPEDALNPDLKVPTEEQFKSKFDASGSGGRPRAAISEIAERAAKDPDYAEALSDAVAAAAPATAAKQAAKAVKTDEGRKAVSKAMVEEARREAAENLAAKGAVKVSATPAGKSNAASASTHDAIEDWKNDILLAAHHLTSALRKWEDTTVKDTVSVDDLDEIITALITSETKASVQRGEVIARKSEIEAGASV